MAFSGKRVTINRSVTLKGAGIHSGQEVTLTLRSAPAGTGLVFQNSDHPEWGSILVSPYHVVETTNAVSVGNRDWRVQTVEHLLAALAAHGISDLIMEVNGTEIPILDGSARVFYEAIQDSGLITYNEDLEPITLVNPVWVLDGDKYLVALPADTYRVTYSIDFPHPMLKGQSISLDIDPDSLAKEILPARTFGFLKDVEAMRERGLIKGGSIDNAVVLTEDGYLNDDLRFPEECVRHKVLDLVGDLYLLGRPLKAHIIASKAGHALDARLARKIQTQSSLDELAKLRDRSTPAGQSQAQTR